MDAMNAFILEELLEDNINIINIVGVAINNLAEPLNILTYNEQYAEKIVPNYTLSQFKSHFRLSRPQVDKICTLLAPTLHNNHLAVPLEKKVLFFIWMLAKQESFLAASDRFGFSKDTGHYVFLKVLEAFVQLKQQFITWPNARESREIQNRIKCSSGFPGVTGIIDVNHIAIKQPTGNNAINFYNRKEFYSVIVQGVCDDRCIFTNVFVGMPGKMRDAQVFRRSPLCQQLKADPPLLAPQQHLIGDGSYPLMLNLLKPYRDNGHLTEQQIKFNQTLAVQHLVIEKAFRLLKGTWRKLKYLDMSLSDKIPEVILAACMLHNFNLRSDEENSNEDHDSGGNDFEHTEEITNGTMKRNHISMLL